MKQISNKEYESYQEYQHNKLYGRVLTPDGLRLICSSLDNDPEKIGKHMLEMLVKFRNEGLFDIEVEEKQLAEELSMPKGVRRTHDEFCRELAKVNKTIQPIEQYQKNTVPIRFKCTKCNTFSSPLSPSALSQRASGPARAPQETEASCLSPDKARGHVPLPAGKP